MMKGMRKRLTVAAMALGLMVLCAIPAMAATKMNYKEVKAGETYFVGDTDIAGHAITSNYFKTEIQTPGSKYDLIFSMGTASNPSIGALVNYTKEYKSSATNAYIKTTSGSNSGYLVGIRVRTGQVKLNLYTTTTDGSWNLSLAKGKGSPLRARTLAKGRRITFYKGAGNVASLPVIFGGTQGARIQRKINSTTFELYVFGPSSLRRLVYKNNKLSASDSRTIKYNSSYRLSGKNYQLALVPMPVNSSNSTGQMKNVKGNICFFYPRDYLKVTFKLN